MFNELKERVVSVVSVVRILPITWGRLQTGPTMLQQLRDWPAVVGDDRLGAALRVGPLGVQVDAQVVVHRGSEVGGGHARVFHLASPGVGAADHLAAGEAASGYQHGHAAGPVLA